MEPNDEQDRMTREYRIGVIGLGAVGGRVVELLYGSDPLIRLVGVSARHPRTDLSIPWYADWHDLVEIADVIIECASQAVAREVIPEALKFRKTVVPASVGVFSDCDWASKTLALLKPSGSRIQIPSGAIGGLDVLNAAKLAGLHRVSLETRKPPTFLGMTVTTPVLVFEGSAREAASRYPQNLNIAMTLALNGLGPDSTIVRLVADPGVRRNTHTIRIESEAGNYRLEFDNALDPDHPKHSFLTAHSIAATVRSLTRINSPLQL